MGKIEKIENVDVNMLVPYAKNAKIHGQNQIEKLKKSIEEFGFLTPCLIDKDFNIIAGHGRVMAAKELNIKAVPCVFVEGLTEAQRRAYILADNRLGELGEWDMELVVEELKVLDNMDFDVSLTGFDFDEVVSDETEAEEDDYQKDAPEEPKSKVGDLYQLGRHRLICGDSSDVTVIEKLLGGGSVQLYITDPPYNVDYEGKAKNHLKIENDAMDDSDFEKFLAEAFCAADLVMNPGAAYYIFYASRKELELFTACKEIGWPVKQVLIWNKNAMALGRQDYQWKHEPCIYGWKEGAGHYFVNNRKLTTVIDEKRPAKNLLHPTMKPIELISQLIKNSSREHDNVLDSFGGSGSTLIACEQLNRNCYICELDPRYVDVIIDRWETLTGEKAQLIE